MSVDLHAGKSIDVASCDRTVHKMKVAADVIATFQRESTDHYYDIRASRKPQERPGWARRSRWHRITIRPHTTCSKLRLRANIPARLSVPRKARREGPLYRAYNAGAGLISNSYGMTDICVAAGDWEVLTMTPSAIARSAHLATAGALTRGIQMLRRATAKMRGLIAGAPTDSYQPELHYMRGPGPKWRERYRSVHSGSLHR
jgi:hypothetical protein